VVGWMTDGRRIEDRHSGEKELGKNDVNVDVDAVCAGVVARDENYDLSD